MTLRARDKSLPSGVLQTRPDGSRYTVADLARYMIAISDNTAADLLIHLVGCAAINPLIPERDRPILTTRELFVLKDPANKGLRERYLKKPDSAMISSGGMKVARTTELPVLVR